MKIDQKVFDGLSQGNGDAIAFISAQADAKTLSQGDIAKTWETVIEFMLKGGSEGMLAFGVKLSTVCQDPEILSVYEDLFSLLAFAKTEMGYVPAIRSGAALARAVDGELPEKLDKGRYLSMAKRCMLYAVANGTDVTKKYALESLRHLNDGDAKRALEEVATGSYAQELKTAAGESLAYLRLVNDIDTAEADRGFLLEIEYADPTSPQRTFTEMIFDSVDTVLRTRGKGWEEIDVEVSVKKLSVLGANPGQMEILFEDKHNLGIITRNVENALLFALTNGNEFARDEAAKGLESIGSDRIEDVLERIAKRMGEKDPLGSLASETLARIRGNKAWDAAEVLPLPSKRAAQLPQKQRLVS